MIVAPLICHDAVAVRSCDYLTAIEADVAAFLVIAQRRIAPLVAQETIAASHYAQLRLAVFIAL